ncbi:hypothetical protein EMCG_04268 [[Emmonsia] crescens]|uniref:L27 domain-containing protein n=1 Tax=[Emmonsia] crescens TaxID=73230 RepID=A0A0G2HSW0_9EURO|nr:hypothetical protein EMCG_04268 [Emmonsia crescens UAMH 3008]
MSTPNLAAIREAHSLIQTKILKTPVHYAPSLSRIAAESAFRGRDNDIEGVSSTINIFLKCENLQKTGSFKFRGVSHFLAKLNDRALRKGLLTYSTGNHAIALAQAAISASMEKGFAIPLTILMPCAASSGKMDKIRKMGVNVTLHGSTIPECAARAEELQQETGMTLVPPSGHPHIVLGQASVMLEFQQQIAELGQGPLDAVIMPSAGGALLAGVAMVCKDSVHPIDVFGAEPLDGGAALSRGRQEGRRVTTLRPEGLTIAEGLCSPVASSNWETVRNDSYVRDVFPASDDEIRAAMRLTIEDTKMMLEPSAAVPLAVILFNTCFQRYMSSRGGPLNIGVILSGGNISVERLFEVLG